MGQPQPRYYEGGLTLSPEAKQNLTVDEQKNLLDDMKAVVKEEVAARNADTGKIMKEDIDKFFEGVKEGVQKPFNVVIEGSKDITKNVTEAVKDVAIDTAKKATDVVSEASSDIAGRLLSNPLVLAGGALALFIVLRR